MPSASGKSSSFLPLAFGVVVVLLLTAQWIDPGAMHSREYISPWMGTPPVAKPLPELHGSLTLGSCSI